MLLSIVQWLLKTHGAVKLQTLSFHDLLPDNPRQKESLISPVMIIPDLNPGKIAGRIDVNISHKLFFACSVWAGMGALFRTQTK